VRGKGEGGEEKGGEGRGGEGKGRDEPPLSKSWIRRWQRVSKAILDQILHRFRCHTNRRVKIRNYSYPTLNLERTITV